MLQPRCLTFLCLTELTCSTNSTEVRIFMSRSFQLQLVHKTLGELGYADVADALAARAVADSQNDQLALSLENYVRKGKYKEALGLVAATDSLHSPVASYLVLRAWFLEQVAVCARGGDLLQLIHFLQNELRDAREAIPRDGALQINEQLSQHLEAARLLPLAMDVPSEAQLPEVLNAELLLTEPRDVEPVGRVRSLLLEHLKPLLALELHFCYSDLVPQHLKMLAEKALLYDTLRLLYYLPPRGERSAAPSREAWPLRLHHTLTHHTDEVWCTRFLPSGRFLCTGSFDGSCVLYDVQNGFLVAATLVASPQEQLAAFVLRSHRPLLEKMGGVVFLAWEPHERYVVTCSLDTVVRVWRVENVTLGKRLTRSNDTQTTLTRCFTLGEAVRLYSCAFLPYPKSATPHFVVGLPDRVLRAFSIHGDEVLDFYTDTEDWDADAANTQFSRVNDFDVTPNGKVLVTANNERQVLIYRIPDLLAELPTTEKLALLNLNGLLTSLRILASGQYMLLSIAPEELQVWDISPVHAGEKPFLKQKFFGQSQATYMLRLCFGYLHPGSNHEELVLSGSDDGYVYIWKLETGQLVTRVHAHHGLCNSVDWNRFYPSVKSGTDYGLFWSSVGDDKLVKIWGPA